ncbi:thiol reductant ABC exporter subunit CydD [Mitsuaria sp. GD03876]|nr:thiol reductant ABC exporter subunit CydD [Mitsuaria sp. GD03876]MDH0866165.1 thiol reductant ABC exporter subunit CydD [Mitsuaria sp. GD03876]
MGPGAVAQALASLLWIPQAALGAFAVQRLADGGGLRAVLMPALGLVIAGVLRAWLDSWGAQRVFARARDFLSTLRADTAETFARRSPLDRDRPASGLAASLIAEQAEALVPWLARHRSARWRVMLVPPLIAVAVAGLSWTAALILVVAMPLIPVFMALIGWRAQAASEAHLVELGQMNAFLLDRLRGLSTIRSLDAVDATARRLRGSAESLRERAMRVLRIAFLSSAALELFSALAVALVAVYIGFHLLGPLSGTGAWGGRLSLGEGLFILMLAPAFFEPMRELAAVWHDKAAGEAALTLLARYRETGMPLVGTLTAPDIARTARAAHPAGTASASTGPDTEDLPTARPGGTGILVRDLAFAHGHEAPVFDGFSLHVRAGEHVALVGPSGAGKSTLLALIAGLLPASAGEIRFDGVRLDDAQADALRQSIAWIGQRPHVFAGPVHRNVGLDRPGVRRADIVEALAIAALDGVANALPEGTLGEQGGGLSGGEQVRLALARAAAHPGATLLLVDEPTAHLDPATAASVIDALLRLARGRTLIVATHDPALIARLDRSIALLPVAASHTSAPSDHSETEPVSWPDPSPAPSPAPSLAPSLAQAIASAPGDPSANRLAALSAPDAPRREGSPA